MVGCTWVSGGRALRSLGKNNKRQIEGALGSGARLTTELKVLIGWRDALVTSQFKAGKRENLLLSKGLHFLHPSL
jgi:hypothetical protein